MMYLPLPVTKMNCSIPASFASSTAYCTTGLSTTGSISFGTALVAGRNRVPLPATGKTDLRIGGGFDRWLGFGRHTGSLATLHHGRQRVHCTACVVLSAAGKADFLN